MTTQHVPNVLTIGAHAPEFDLPGTDGNSYSLESFAGSRALAVIFLANHCPYVSAWEDRILAIARDFADRGAAFVGISANDVDKFPQDAPDEMRKRVEEKQYPFPYLYDEDQSVARAFGAVRTPEVFLFDGERHLRYHGAVDSDWEESATMQNYLRDALNALLFTSQEPLQDETPVVGCTIKWKA